MKQSIYILLLTVTGIFAGCTDIDKENPYDNQLHSLQVTAVYPDGYTDHLREGVTVKIEDVDRGNSYKAKTDKNGVAQFSLTKGIYRVQVSDKDGKDIFNGLADNVKLTSGDMSLNLPLIHSKAGPIPSRTPWPVWRNSLPRRCQPTGSGWRRRRKPRSKRPGKRPVPLWSRCGTRRIS